MPANLIPHAAIPKLAEQVTPEMLKILRHIQKADFVVNSAGLARHTVETLERLSTLGLVDPGYEGEASGKPSIWVANGNGSRVLVYKTGIRGGPHYELPSTELAAWLEEQGPDLWWNVDGDPLLTGRLTFPCPARTLAAELRIINRPLLVQVKKDDTAATGQPISKDRIDVAVDRLGDNVQLSPDMEPPSWSEDRILYLCWKGSTDEWLLAEDPETTALMQAEVGNARDVARVEKQ
jgi:hypothetical protein